MGRREVQRETGRLECFRKRSTVLFHGPYKGPYKMVVQLSIWRENNVKFQANSLRTQEMATFCV